MYFLLIDDQGIQYTIHETDRNYFFILRSYFQTHKTARILWEAYSS